MTFAAPDYFAGAPNVPQLARAIVGTAGWMRRRCNEVLAETALDVIKIYDLGQQCRVYREYIDSVLQSGDVTAVLEAIVALLQQEGVGRPTLTSAQANTELKAVYQAAGTFLTWATANLPTVGQTLTNPTVTVNRTFNSPDMTVTVTKVAAVTTQVTALRAAFA